MHTHHHVSVSNSLNFINIVAPNDPVEHRVQVIEEVDNLQRSALSRHGGEADDVTEVDSDRVKGLGFHSLAGR